jgi:hypothetical protein
MSSKSVIPGTQTLSGRWWKARRCRWSPRADPRRKTLRESLTAMAGVIQAGGRGATIGRNVWGVAKTTEALRAFKAVMLEGQECGCGAERRGINRRGIINLQISFKWPCQNQRTSRPPSNGWKRPSPSCRFWTCTRIYAERNWPRKVCMTLLLYHMVVSDLYSAGCPSGARLTQFPNWPSQKEAHQRISRSPALFALHSEHKRLVGRPHHSGRSLRLARTRHCGQLAAA